MKLLLYLVLFNYLQFMDFKEFETLLGKPISFSEETMGNDFKNDIFRKDFYYISNEFVKKNFYNMSYNCFSIQIDSKNNLKSITIYFNEMINNEFYKSFIKVYGNPNSIQVIENRNYEGEWVDVEDGHKVRRATFKLREGSFEEKPLFILWNKKEYQIKAFLRHKSNISELTFRIPTDGF